MNQNVNKVILEQNLTDSQTMMYEKLYIKYSNMKNKLLSFTKNVNDAYGAFDKNELYAEYFYIDFKFQIIKFLLKNSLSVERLSFLCDISSNTIWEYIKNPDNKIYFKNLYKIQKFMDENSRITDDFASLKKNN